MFLTKLLLPLVVILGHSAMANAAVTAKQREQIAKLTDDTRTAGRLFNNGKYAECAAKINETQKSLTELLQSPTPGLDRLSKPLYLRLKRAHALLELEGLSIDPLPTWKDLTSPKESTTKNDAPDREAISFTSDIAPWLISECGSCHINNRRGNFSLASFSDLLQGINGNVVLFPGGSKGSRIVEVIESGDMPRGGRRVTDEQLAQLKLWIDQGAKFDGPNPRANLSSFVTSNEQSNRGRPKVNLPTGSETVSFATDIAPILSENCNGCHIGGRRASGGFRMDNFNQLIRGGDSGPAIEGRNASETLLVKKLKGESGDRMPAGGRPALSSEQITLISTWIREGATFDGSGPEVDIDTVASEAWAGKATHKELFNRRRERAQQRWTRALPNQAPTVAMTDELMVLGDLSPERTELSKTRLTESLVLAKKLLKRPADEPLIKGGLVVYVLKSRYDYSEFGRMTENRELPRNWLGHWQADPLDVYGVLSFDANREEDQDASLMLQIITGAYFGSFREVPNWFSEGLARNFVRQQYRRSDARVNEWQRLLPVAIQQIDSAKSLNEDQLDEETAGVVGMGLTGYVLGQKRVFNRLHELLLSGETFSSAALKTIGPVDLFVQRALGKKK